MSAVPVSSFPFNGFQWASAPLPEFRILASHLDAAGSVLRDDSLALCRDAVGQHLWRPGPDSQRNAVMALVDSYREDYLERLAEGDWSAVTERFVGRADARRSIGTETSFLGAHIREFSKLGIIQWPRGQGAMSKLRTLPTFEDLELRARCSYSSWVLQPMADLSSYPDCREQMARRTRPLSLSPQWRLAHCRWMHPYESVLHDFVHFGGVVLCLDAQGRLSRQIEFYDAADALMRRFDVANLPCVGLFLSLREALLEGTLDPEGLGAFIHQKLADTLSEPSLFEMGSPAVSVYAGLAEFLRGRPESWWDSERDCLQIRWGLESAVRRLGF